MRIGAQPMGESDPAGDGFGCGIPDFCAAAHFRQILFVAPVKTDVKAACGLGRLWRAARLLNGGDVTMPAAEGGNGLVDCFTRHFALNFRILPTSRFLHCWQHLQKENAMLSLLWKMITLGGAMILLVILMMVRRTIVERCDYQKPCRSRYSSGTSGPQKVVGPLVAVPVTELYTVLEEGSV